MPKARPLNSIGPIKSVNALARRGENGIAGLQICIRFSQKGQNRDQIVLTLISFTAFSLQIQIIIEFYFVKKVARGLEKYVAKMFIRTRLLLLNKFPTFSAQSARKS